MFQQRISKPFNLISLKGSPQCFSMRKLFELEQIKTIMRKIQIQILPFAQTLSPSSILKQLMQGSDPLGTRDTLPGPATSLK